jgi:GNAT superfamily N-acetyltransferase
VSVRLVPLSERQELEAAVFSPTLQSLWPAFMMNDRTADLYFAPPHFAANHRTAFAVVDAGHPGEVVGRAFSVALRMEGVAGREALPDEGWDAVIRWGHEDRALGREPDALSALEILLRPEWRGRGAARAVLDGMRARAAELGLRHMVAPVRPTRKSGEPLTPMAEYARRVRADGLPFDPWLRLHAEAGGRIEKVAPLSMTIAGTLADWRGWTGLPFDAPGPAIVPGALVRVQVAPEQDHAVYVEPNVWVRHVVPAR